MLKLYHMGQDSEADPWDAFYDTLCFSVQLAAVPQLGQLNFPLKQGDASQSPIVHHWPHDSHWKWYSFSTVYLWLTGASLPAIR